MKRPLIVISLCYIFGILISSYKNWVCLLIFSLIFIILCLLFLRPKKVSIFLVLLILIFNCGYIYSYMKSNIKNSNVVGFENDNICIKAVFLQKIKKDEQSSSFVVKAYKVNDINIKPEKIRISYFENDLNVEELKYGNLLSIKGKVTIPSGKRNPGGFDYRKYLLTQSIYTVINAQSITVETGKGKHSNIVNLSLFMRDKISDVIQISLPSTHAALLEGIVLSKTDQLDRQTKQDFSDSGLSHLMAVSGMNVAFLVLPLLFIMNKFKINNKISGLIMTIILGLFVIITGSNPSVVRAVIMSLVVIYGNIIGKQSDVLTSMAFSALLILIYNPLLIFDIGFQLSYGATLSIILLYSKFKTIFKNMPNALSDTLGVVLSAQAGVIPIIAYNFNKISIVSIIANVLAAPLSGVVLVSGLCMAVFGQIHILISQFIGGFNYLVLAVLLSIAQKTAAIPYAVLTVSTPSIVIIIVYYLILLCISFWDVIFPWVKSLNLKISFNRFCKIGIGFAVCIFILNCFMQRPLEVSYLDVGQGDAAFVRTPRNKVVLLDCGGIKKTGADDMTIVPFLLDKGVRNIDIIILSHNDWDHICALKDIDDNFNIKSLVILDTTTKEDLDLDGMKNRHIKIVPMELGKVDVEKGLYLQIMSAGQKLESNHSLVVRLCYKDRKFLFTGDISQDEEQALARCGYDLYSDVLKVAHHGSKYSTSSDFLDLVKPRAAVISAGKNNMYGHPSSIVIERLNNRNINTFRTDKDGCVSMLSNGNYIKIKTMNGDKTKI